MGDHRTRGGLQRALEDFGTGLRAIFGHEERDVIAELLERPTDGAGTGARTSRRTPPRRPRGRAGPRPLVLVK